MFQNQLYVYKKKTPDKILVSTSYKTKLTTKQFSKFRIVEGRKVQEFFLHTSIKKRLDV